MIDITTVLGPAKGFLTVDVLDKDKQPIAGKSAEFQQVFTDYGFTTLYGGDSAGAATMGTGGGSGGVFNFCRVGTGNVERVVTDTGLGNALGVYAYALTTPLSTVTHEVHNGRTYAKTVRRFTFAFGAVATTISEVGIFKDSGTNTMVAGQLIKDGLGNPTTITVLADEQLTVTYTVYIEMPRVSTSTGSADPLTIASGQVTVNSTPYDYEIRLAGYSWVYSGTLGASNYTLICGFPTGTTSYVFLNGLQFNVTGTSQTTTKVVFSNRIESTVSFSFAPSTGDLSVASIETWSGSSQHRIYGIHLTPALPKTSSQTLQISFKHTLKWREL